VTIFESEYDTAYAPLCCTHCGQELDYEECDQCGGDGYFDDEWLMEEDPLWYQPGDTEACTQCGGEGGWHYCSNRECPGKRDEDDDA
jgi:hypothetical protein